MCEPNTVDLSLTSKTLMGRQPSRGEDSNDPKNVAPSLQEKKFSAKQNNDTKEWNENQVGAPVLRRSQRIRERQLAKLANTLGSEKKIKKDENEKDRKEKEKRRTNVDRLRPRRLSPSSETEVCNEKLPSSRQSTKITPGRPHSLQLGASSQDDTKPSFAKWRHKNKKRTVTTAPLFSTNRLSPISEENPDIMFNGNDVKYEECCDNVVTKIDNETFRPRANAEEHTKGTRWDDILGEIDWEIAGDASIKGESFELSALPEEVIFRKELKESGGDDVDSPEWIKEKSRQANEEDPQLCGRENHSP